MEPEGSLPHSQVPATCPYPEPARSSPYPHIPLPEGPPYYYPPIEAWNLQVVSFPRVSPPNSVYISAFSIRATCPTHLILNDFITRKTFGEQYRSLSCPFFRFLQSPVTTSLLGPNIFLSILFSNTLSLSSSLNVSDQVSHP